MSTKKTKRTDPHRPGAIVPAEYEYVFSYNLATSQDGWPVPSLHVNCEIDYQRRWKDEEGHYHVENGEHSEHGDCCVVGLLHIAKVKFGGRGGTGKCSVCGAAFVYGDVWRHVPTGEYIHVGHICARKYGLLTDRSAWELEFGQRKRATARECLKAQKEEERKAFLEDHPGLEEALKRDHHILRDLAAQLQTRCCLSDKQVALAFKIKNDLDNPEPTVDAPEGRVDFEGEIISIKRDDMGYYGPTTKITVKVQGEGGIWLAHGTCPAAILGDVVQGAKVALRATLKRGSRSSHFAFMKRPCGKILTTPNAEAVANV